MPPLLPMPFDAFAAAVVTAIRHAALFAIDAAAYDAAAADAKSALSLLRYALC